MKLNDINVSETITLPYEVKAADKEKIRVFLKLKRGFFITALLSDRTEAAYEMINGINRAVIVFQTTVQNTNPVIHSSIPLIYTAFLKEHVKPSSILKIT